MNYLTKASITKNKLRQLPKVAVYLISAVFWLGVWQIVYLAVGSDLIVASPFMTFKRVIELSLTMNFWECTLNSVFHILAGFIFAVITAIIFSALGHVSVFFNIIFSPIVKIVRATPVASFIVLALFWLKGSVPSFIAFLMVIPVVYSNLFEGFQNISKELVEISEIYQFSLFKKIRLIYLPSLMPYFVSACSVGLGFAWKSGIAAEVIGLPKKTLGLEIYNAKIYIETVDLFALTAVIIFLSILIEKVFMFLLKKSCNRILRGGETK